MISAGKTLARPPGSGAFTCCMRDHKMKNLDGTERGIPCDKLKIGQLTWTMLQSKLSFMLGDDQMAEYRMWLALIPRFMQGLPNAEAALKACRSSRLDASAAEDAAKDFLSTYHFKTPKDEEGLGESGLSPLGHAVMVGAVEVAAELMKQGANVNCKLRTFNATIAADVGMNVLHLAVSICPARNEEMIAVLLHFGADANASSKSGATPLMGEEEDGRHAFVVRHDLVGRSQYLVRLQLIELDKTRYRHHPNAVLFVQSGAAPRP